MKITSEVARKIMEQILTVQEGRTTSPRQILLKSAQTLPRYRDLSIFQDGGRRYLGF